MTTRQVVQDLAKLGPLPDSSASEEKIGEHEALLMAITRPVTDDEAALLVKLFGPDDCYGLAWALLHLIESAPSGIPIKVEPSADDNQWIRRLWARSYGP